MHILRKLGRERVISTSLGSTFSQHGAPFRLFTTTDGGPVETSVGFGETEEGNYVPVSTEDAGVAYNDFSRLGLFADIVKALKITPGNLPNIIIGKCISSK